MTTKPTSPLRRIKSSLDVDGCSPAAKFVLVVLWIYADEHGSCWPSQSRLARQTGFSPRHVRREDADLLTSEQTVRSDGKYGVNTYRLQDTVGRPRPSVTHDRRSPTSSGPEDTQVLRRASRKKSQKKKASPKKSKSSSSTGGTNGSTPSSQSGMVGTSRPSAIGSAKNSRRTPTSSGDVTPIYPSFEYFAERLGREQARRLMKMREKEHQT
jgi:hypothetical protein